MTISPLDLHAALAPDSGASDMTPNMLNILVGLTDNAKQRAGWGDCQGANDALAQAETVFRALGSPQAFSSEIQSARAQVKLCKPLGVVNTVQGQLPGYSGIIPTHDSQEEDDQVRASNIRGLARLGVSGIGGYGLGLSADDSNAWSNFNFYNGQARVAAQATPPDMLAAAQNFQAALNIYQTNSYVQSQVGMFDINNPDPNGGDQLSYTYGIIVAAGGDPSSTVVQTTQGNSTDALTQGQATPALIAQAQQNAQPDSVLAAAASGFGQGLQQGAKNLINAPGAAAKSLGDKLSLSKKSIALGAGAGSLLGGFAGYAIASLDSDTRVGAKSKASSTMVGAGIGGILGGIAGFFGGGS